MTITLNNAGKRFNREWIFRNLTYQFNSTKSYAITGHNGSGKSTLLQVLSSALMLNDGTVQWQIDDKLIASENVHQFISIAAPYFELIEEMTAKEFLLFHSQFKKYINNFLAKDILSKVELADSSNKQIRFFSSGMKQRLKLAQAVFSDVPIILLDEPCTNLDANGFKLYYELINSYCKNRLLIISSNDVNEYNFCNEKINIQDYK